MTDEESNAGNSENSVEKPTIGSAKVQIGTQPEGAAGVEAMKLPLRVLVLGDFVPKAPDVQDWESSSRLVNVTPGNFQSVMQQLSPRLSLNLPNRLSDKPKEVTVELSFPDMKAFGPAGIARQVDALAGLLVIRDLASQVKDGKLKPEEFEERLQQAGIDAAWIERFHQMMSAPEAAATEPVSERPPVSDEAKDEKPEGDAISLLDSLLDKVDVGSKQAPGAPSAEAGHIDDLMRAITGPKKGEKVDKSVFDVVIDESDQTLSDQINDILHHSEFQQLESTWRGLRLLIDRTDFQEDIKIELLSAHKDELRDAIYHQVFTPEYNEVTETPLSVMIADYEFKPVPEDVELLGDIARMAASIQVPFIASVGPPFFGVQTAEEQAKLSLLRSHFRKPEYAKWNALRDNEESQYVAVTMPRFLLRFPYGPDGMRVKEFNFVESAKSAAEHLWCRGVFALATTLVRSFAEDGWCIRITGLSGGGVVENLPVWSYRTAGRDVQIPLDVSFSNTREREFMDTGFVLLSSRINDNKATMLSAPTLYRPKQYTSPEETKEAQMHATLPYQFFATRMAHYLRRLVREVSTGLTAEQAQRVITGKLRTILAKPGVELPPEAVRVEVSDSEEKPGYYNVIMQIQPPFKILGRDVDLLLGVELHR